MFNVEPYSKIAEVLSVLMTLLPPSPLHQRDILFYYNDSSSKIFILTLILFYEILKFSS